MCTINIGIVTSLNKLEEHIEDIIVNLSHAYQCKTLPGKYDLVMYAIKPITETKISQVRLAESIIPQLHDPVRKITFTYRGAEYTVSTHEGIEGIKDKRRQMQE